MRRASAAVSPASIRPALRSISLPEKEIKMRKWHRWAAIPAGLFLFFVSLTGVLLHLDMMRVGASPPGHELPRKIEVQPLPDNARLVR